MTAAFKARAAAPSFLSTLSWGLGLMLTPIIRRRAFAKLDELDDRMLNDIGLTRFDVDAMRRMW